MLELQQLALWIEASKQGIRKKNVRIIRDIPSLVLAYKAVSGMQSAVYNHSPLTPTCANIGKLVCVEFEDTDIPEEKKLLARVDVGYHLLNVLFAHKKLKIGRPRNSRDSYSITIIDDAFIDAMLYSIDAEPLKIQLHTKPSLSEPLPFTKFNHPVAGELVRKTSPDAKSYFTYDKCPGVFDTINRHMKIPYCVNTDLLEVFQMCRKDDFFRFKGKDLNPEQRIGLTREQTAVLDIAAGLGDSTFWQHMFYDFRGRLYSSLIYFSPQGSKLSKSLFYLGNDKPIGTEGWTWLLLHAANVWGEDKKPIDERVDYAEGMLPEWLEIAANPIDNKRWQEASDPYGFLATIMELHKAVKSGDKFSFSSGLICSWDATCSGLQVLAALTRDEKAGKLCNLTNSGERGDYYQHIADAIWGECVYEPEDEITFDYITDTMRILNQDVERPPVGVTRREAIDERKMFTDLHREEIIASAKVFWGRKVISDKQRGIVKRPCMTYLYSCQAKTMAKQLYTDFRTDPDFAGIQLSYCYWLSHRIYKNCRALMPGPTDMMDALIDMGKADYREGLDFTIVAPFTKFLLHQYYRNPLTKELKVKYFDESIRLVVLIGKGEKVGYQKVSSATSPNVVHMLDSQIVAKVIMSTDYDVNCIHDSFGTCPADAGKLFEDVRISFVDLFHVDLLQELLDQKDYKSTIELGALNINDVLDDDYTFC